MKEPRSTLFSRLYRESGRLYYVEMLTTDRTPPGLIIITNFVTRTEQCQRLQATKTLSYVLILTLSVECPLSYNELYFCKALITVTARFALLSDIPISLIKFIVLNTNRKF